jgi:hypothetical protein
MLVLQTLVEKNILFKAATQIWCVNFFTSFFPFPLYFIFVFAAVRRWRAINTSQVFRKINSHIHKFTSRKYSASNANPFETNEPKTLSHLDVKDHIIITTVGFPFELRFDSFILSDSFRLIHLFDVKTKSDLILSKKTL